MRRYVAIFAVLALSLLLLRPACDVLALQLTPAQGASATLLHHDAASGAEHRDLLQVGSHWSSLATVASTVKNLLAGPAPFIMALSVAALSLFLHGAAPGAAPLPTRTYYARSARILR